MPTLDPALIVPIDLAALLVGDADAPAASTYFGAVAADFSNLPYLDADGQGVNAKANIAAMSLSAPLEPADTPPRPGVHLHWALPDAIARGAADENGKIGFTAAPNRWLVVRTVVDTSAGAASPPASTLAAWVVESDHLWDREAAWSPTPQSGKDSLPQNGLSRAVPIALTQTPGAKPYTYQGRVFRLDDWNGSMGDSYAAQHTVVGYGDPAYAAAYPHCPNVFAFHDPADDLAPTLFKPGENSLSYLVVGWYADLAKDPLNAFPFPAGADTAAKRLDALRAAFGWGFSLDPAGLPSRTVCSGLLRGVTWAPKGAFLKPLSGAGVDVAIGNTTAEALSAQLAALHPDKTGLETLLNCFQLGLLNTIGHPGALSDADEDQHLAGFGASSAGSLWRIQRATVANQDSAAIVSTTDADLLAAGRATATDLPPGVAELLNQLNTVQQDADGAAFEIQTRQRQIFTDWYKYLLLEHPEQPNLLPTTLVSTDDAAKIVLDQIEVLLGVDIHATDADLATIAARRDFALSAAPGASPPAVLAPAAGATDLVSALFNARANVAELTSQLSSKLGADYQVIVVEAPRYYQPGDLVVLLTGVAATPSPRHGGDGRADANGDLVCRTSSQVVQDVMAGSFAIGAADTPTLSPNASAALPPEARGLVTEASLVDPDRRGLLAAAVARQCGGAFPGGVDRAAFTIACGAAQQAFLDLAPASDLVVFQGVAPSPIGVQVWAQPWIPLLLQWEIAFTPAHATTTPQGQQSDYPPDFITTSFSLDADEIELQRLAAQPTGADELFRGSLVLAGRTEINLASQLQAYVSQNPDDPNAPDLKALAQSLTSAAMAQALSGFNEAMQMRGQTLQLPVADPIAPSFMRDRMSNALTPVAVGNQNRTAPLPLAGFNPLRAGTLRLSRLRLVDAFGQIRDIIDISRVDGSVANPTPVVAASLKPRGPTPLDGGQALLPPRMAQPSRLLFRWLSAQDDLVESNDDPAANPICGWVLFNHLDTSLMVYDADGTPIGSLNVLGPLWQPAPGSTRGWQGDDPIARAKDSLSGANSHLSGFVLGALQAGVDFIEGLLDVIDKQMTAINPLGFKQDQGLSLLIGQPLALARASVRLEVQGLRALDESWAAFQAAVQADTGDPADVRERRDGGLGSLSFPLRLGDLGILEDGLVGVYIDDGGPGAYQTFYAAAASTKTGVVPPDPARFVLTPADSGEDATGGLVLSLLLDPRGLVHATTGVLPVKSISIPDEMYSDALARMSVTFLTTPVVAGPEAIGLPLPRELGRVWSWVSRAGPEGVWSTTSSLASVNTSSAPAVIQHIEEGWLRLDPAGAKGTNR